MSFIDIFKLIPACHLYTSLWSHTWNKRQTLSRQPIHPTWVRERGGCRGRDGETKAAASSPQRQQHVPEEPACSCMIDFTCDAAACRGGCVMRTKQTTSQFSATTEAGAVCVVEPGTVSNISGNYCTCLYLQDGGTSSLASCKCQSDMALQANSWRKVNEKHFQKKCERFMCM